MSARITVIGNLRSEPWLRLTPTIRGRPVAMDTAVDVDAGDAEVACGITLTIPPLYACGEIRAVIAVEEAESVQVDFLEPWRTLVNALVPRCT